MPQFRRFTRSNFRQPRRSFSRFRRGLGTVHRPIRWNRANFHLSALHAHLDADTRNIVTTLILARMQNVTGSMGALPGDTFGQMARSLQIGGIKFTAQRRLVRPVDPALELTPNDWFSTVLREVDTKVLIVSDSQNLDPATGVTTPSALLPDWFTNTLPIATTVQPEDTDMRFPQRVHWQDFRRLDASLDQYQEATVSGGEEPSQHVYTKSLQSVVPVVTGANLRLRLRLQDDEVLAVQFASKIPQSAAEENGLECQFVISGSLWWRVGRV